MTQRSECYLGNAPESWPLSKEQTASFTALIDKACFNTVPPLHLCSVNHAWRHLGKAGCLYFFNTLQSNRLGMDVSFAHGLHKFCPFSEASSRRQLWNEAMFPRSLVPSLVWLLWLCWGVYSGSSFVSVTFKVLHECGWHAFLELVLLWSRHKPSIFHLEFWEES